MSMVDQEFGGLSTTKCSSVQELTHYRERKLYFKLHGGNQQGRRNVFYLKNQLFKSEINDKNLMSYTMG